MEKFTGKVWLLGDDIDTDIIMPTEYLVFKTIEEMKPYAFSPLRPELAAQIRPGDIIVAGSNFGCGSSREQAPEVVKALGLRCVIAKSFARIFFRNAINNGLLLIENADLAGIPHRFPAGQPGGDHQCRRPGEGHAEAERAGLKGAGYGKDHC